MPPISKMSGGKGVSNIARIVESTCGTDRFEVDPSEKESGVALIMAMMRGVGWRKRKGTAG
jgi:hypothetical protein